MARIGILALQGAFIEHERMLREMGAYHRAVAYVQVSRNPDLSSENGVVAYFRAPRNPDLRDKQRALSDFHVVRYLDEVVNFRARAD